MAHDCDFPHSDGDDLCVGSGDQAANSSDCVHCDSVPGVSVVLAELHSAWEDSG